MLTPRSRFTWSAHQGDLNGASETPFTGSDSGSARGVDDERRSKSSLDIRKSGSDSPPISRRKKLWNSFKRRTRNLRSRSREKLHKKKRDSLDCDARSDHQEASGSEEGPPPVSPANFGNKPEDFDSLFEACERRLRSEGDGLPGNGPVSTVTRGRSWDDKESEVDSGIAVVDHSEAASVRQRHNALRGHPFFQMEVILKEGRDLVVRDSCGTSDPYVKFKIGGRQYYKSRTVFKNLNPKWDEKFSLPIEDPFRTIQVRVFDYDRGLNDDPMGGADLDPSSLEPNVPTEVRLELISEKKGKVKEADMGYVTLQCTLVPKTQDEKEQYFKRMSRLGDTAKKMKTQIWSSVVTIVLIEGSELLPMDDNGFSDPYVKFRLGNERYKSKCKPKTLNPRWLEQFDLYMFDDQTSHLELSVWDHDIGGKDDIMGRCSVDLHELEREKTHTLPVALEDGAGTIHLLLTISGMASAESISDLSNYAPNPKERESIVRKYGLVNSVKAIKDVGWLQVKVIKAQGLAAADLGGKSDPFCVMELVNARLQTQTEYKTLYPEWGKVFTFNVKDIHSILEVTVYDEDRDKKSEFLGKVAIPILRLKNGERKWYSLKDRKLALRAKGAIQIEMDFVYNHVKAAIRTFNPREEKYMQPEPKFKLAVMKRNIDRVSKIAAAGVEAGKFLESCFDWESKARSSIAFAVFLIIVWNFELYMVPVTVLIIFLKNLLVVQIVGNLMKDKDEDKVGKSKRKSKQEEYVDEEDDDDDEEQVKTKHNKQTMKAKKRHGKPPKIVIVDPPLYDKPKQEEKKSFKEKLQAIQDVCLQVQEGMDMAASMGERVKNTFNWTVPWLSWLAITVLTIASLILYNVPVRYLVMAWGINKFTKKLRAPNAIPNNELADYLSRVPSDKELMMYRELRPDPNIGTMKNKKTK